MSRLLISVAGTEHELFLGGVADASFPERTPAELAELPPGDNFGVQWEDAIFTGRHSVLGEVTASLNPEGGPSGPSFVRSLQPASAAASTHSAEFFPAVNRNFLRFELRVPRLNLVLGSDEPVVNEAEIREIPPYNATYKLVRPVVFRPQRKSLLRPMSVVAPDVTIQACDVKLVIGHGLDPSLSLLADDGDSVRFRVDVSKSTTDPIDEYAWTVWPRPEIESTHWHGVRPMNGAADTFEVSLKRDIFFRERWLRVVPTRPFETEVSGAEEFPALP